MLFKECKDGLELLEKMMMLCLRLIVLKLVGVSWFTCFTNGLIQFRLWGS